MKKTSFRLYLYPLFLVLLSGVFLFSSCRKDEEEDEEQRIVVNEEFHELMQKWYFWYDDMPEVNPSQYGDPYELLEALRFRPLDRWSYISSKEEFESYYQESKFIGYGFGSAWDEDGRLRVAYIFSTTDMYEEGVRRSWIIDKVNGTSVRSGTNINQLLGANEVGVSNTFSLINPQGELVEMTLEKKEVVMNTVLHKEVLDAGSKKAGYIVFKGFTQPSFDELDSAVTLFLSEGIDELILDLRYNGGGQTSVANYLASIIGNENIRDQPFAEYQYNDKNEDQNFIDTFQLADQNLVLDRLVTIASRQTASASEMVINGLKPFMPVYIVGDNTYGKPMGMNAWYYGEEYAFVPVTFKIANADGEGDYFDGLNADSYVSDDITRFFGDPEETSLKEALKFIETGSFSGLPKKKSLFVQPYEQMTGLREEIGAH